MSTEFTLSTSQPGPIIVKPTAMTCNECKHEFMADLIFNCTVTVALAAMRGTVCPNCESGYKSLTMGHKPPVIERPLEGSQEHNVRAWMIGDDTGSSSMTLAEVFLNVDKVFGIAHPRDPADLGRCLRLIKRVPEVRSAVDQLAGLNANWARLAPRWDELAALMEEECGISGEKNWGLAPKTHMLMCDIYEQG